MTEGTPDVRQEYIDSLKELRRDAGCTPEGLMKHPQLLARVRERCKQRNASTDIQACLTELERTVRLLGNQAHRDALVVALRFDRTYREASVTARRKHYKEDLEATRYPGVRPADIRRLQSREDKAIEEVAQLLMEEVSEGGSLATPTVNERKPSSPDYYRPVEASSHTYYFSQTGAVVKTETRLWLRAYSSEPMRYFEAWRRYYSDRRRGVLEFQPMFGCQITKIEEDDAGGVDVLFEAFEDLSMAESYPCAYEVIVHSNKRCEAVIQIPLRRPGQRIECQLIFHSDFTPVRAWWSRSRNDVGGRMEPPIAEGRHLKLLDSGRYLYKIFDTTNWPPMSLANIAWIWPDHEESSGVQ